MGGSGSGRFGERFNTLFVDDCAILRLHDLRRERLLIPGEICAGAARLSDGNDCWVQVDVTDREAGWLTIGQQRIRISSSAGTTGGLRYWFHCPKYDSRIAALYRHPRVGRFTGRRASRLRYRSNYQSDLPAAVIRAQKALMRVAGPNYTGPRPRSIASIPKPHRRWWTTHHRHQLAAASALMKMHRQLAAELGSILGTNHRG